MVILEATTSFNFLFYISAAFVIIILGLIAFFIKKLNYNFKKIMKSIWKSLLITSIIEVLLFITGAILGWFVVFCKPGGNCPNPLEVFFSLYFPITAISIFLITLLIYYIIKFLRNNK